MFDKLKQKKLILNITSSTCQLPSCPFSLSTLPLGEGVLTPSPSCCSEVLGNFSEDDFWLLLTRLGPRILNRGSPLIVVSRKPLSGRSSAFWEKSIRTHLPVDGVHCCVQPACTEYLVFAEHTPSLGHKSDPSPEPAHCLAWFSFV